MHDLLNITVCREICVAGQVSVGWMGEGTAESLMKDCIMRDHLAPKTTSSKPSSMQLNINEPLTKECIFDLNPPVPVSYTHLTLPTMAVV